MRALMKLMTQIQAGVCELFTNSKRHLRHLIYPRLHLRYKI